MKVFNGDIRILGPRPSGKMTFLVALACFPNVSDKNNPVFSIELLNEEAQFLAEMGDNILRQGAMLSPMEWPEAPLDCPSYHLQIIVKPKFNLINAFTKQDIKLDFSCTAYAGEFFDTLFECPEQQWRSNNYLNDLATVNQIMLIIDATSSTRDRDYAHAISILEKELNSCITSRRTPAYKVNYRVAVVFSKFDQSPAYNYRHNLDEFITLKFPKIYSTLEGWRNAWNCSISYFACSAFGVVGNLPKPNAVAGKSGSCFCLKEPDVWKPFGLVSPIYWLLTGKKDRRLSYDF
ncbi:hypothetical protein QUB00_26870 [Microcoleus sp. F8_C2]